MLSLVTTYMILEACVKLNVRDCMHVPLPSGAIDANHCMFGDEAAEDDWIKRHPGYFVFSRECRNGPLPETK